jgi:hypothetical protein
MTCDSGELPYPTRVERIYPTQGRLRVNIHWKEIRIEKEEDRVEMKGNRKTEMMRNRQTTGKKGREIAGRHDLKDLLPPESITNYGLRITRRGAGDE